MDRFPVLRRKARHQASTLSGGEQKMLEIARGLLLHPKLMLIDEPSIGLSPILVEELFGLLHELRASGITRPDDRAERQARAGELRLTASCSSSAARASRTARMRSSPIRASGSCSSAAGWSRQEPSSGGAR